MFMHKPTLALLLAVISAPAFASAPWAPTPACGEDSASQLAYSMALPLEFSALAPALEQIAVASESALSADADDADDAVMQSAVLEDEIAGPAAAVVASPRELLVEFAMQLRNIRYRRGGRSPTTGFDCSGFVHYVFAKTLGIDLPNNSASQFSVGEKITRGQMQTGDLVFFHTHGKRISHVGIYLDHGRFIHSPTTGKRVQVDFLDESYWAKRFAGARRMNILT